MRSNLLSAASSLITLALVCAVPAPAQDEFALARQVAASNNAFGVALYHEFTKEPGNLVFSPFSLSSALALTASGARGQTERELRQALCLGLPREKVEAGYGEFGQIFENAVRHDLATLTVANSIWPQRDYSVDAEFLAMARRQFGTEVHSLDYEQPEAAANEINRWVDAKTEGQVPALVSPMALSHQPRLVLCNAIHFRAAWMHEFAKTATEPAEFALLDHGRIVVPTMRQTEWFDVAKANGCRLLRLPYGAGFEMLIVLPTEIAGLPDLEESLDVATLEHWLGTIDEAERQYLALELPRFRTSARPDCLAALARLGVKAAFDWEAADFSRISNEPGLAIGGVVHESKIDVNEQGTEAVAATYVALAAFGAGKPRLPTPIPFKVDHPFLFLIRETRSGVILFMGRIVDPRHV